MVRSDDWSHEAEFAAELLSAALARDFVGVQLVAHHLPRLVDDVCLVVSELATNAIVHARTPFHVTLSREGSSIVLTVEDTSLSVLHLPKPDTRRMSGRGLLIIEALSDAWGTRTDGEFKTVWASFRCAEVRTGSDPRAHTGAGVNA